MAREFNPSHFTLTQADRQNTSTISHSQLGGRPVQWCTDFLGAYSLTAFASRKSSELFGGSFQAGRETRSSTRKRRAPFTGRFLPNLLINNEQGKLSIMSVLGSNSQYGHRDGRWAWFLKIKLLQSAFCRHHLGRFVRETSTIALK
jgi:hypothetical protein